MSLFVWQLQRAVRMSCAATERCVLKVVVSVMRRVKIVMTIQSALLTTVLVMSVGRWPVSYRRGHEWFRVGRGPGPSVIWVGLVSDLHGQNVTFLLLAILWLTLVRSCLLRKWDVLRLFAGDFGLVLSDVLYVISDCRKMNMGYCGTHSVIQYQ